jgi:hypothetical protein
MSRIERSPHEDFRPTRWRLYHRATSSSPQNPQNLCKVHPEEPVDTSVNQHLPGGQGHTRFETDKNSNTGLSGELSWIGHQPHQS